MLISENVFKMAKNVIIHNEEVKFILIINPHELKKRIPIEENFIS